VYAAGIALNVVAVVAAGLAGEWVFAGTFLLVIGYLGVRYWLLDSS
jgi:hypothetical protein